MKVFLSWSGERSRLLADALKDWLPSVLQNLDPWLSSRDIGKGTRWAIEMTRELSQTGVGILCLTRENLSSPWLHFEAGALSKALDDARVCTLLLDVTPTDLAPPLSLFQWTNVDRDDIAKLVVTLHRVSAVGTLSDSQLHESVAVWWPKLEARLANIPANVSTNSGPVRTDRDVMNEILESVRALRKTTAEAATVRIARARLAELEVIRRQELASREAMQKDLESCVIAQASLARELAEAETTGTADLVRLRDMARREQERRKTLEDRLHQAQIKDTEYEANRRELQRLATEETQTS